MVEGSGPFLFSVSKLSAGYDEVAVICEASLQVKSGEVISVFGPNGCGKTTFLRAIGGVLSFYGGSILTGSVFIDGHDVSRTQPNKLCRDGLIFVPSGGRIFSSLSVRENIQISALLVNRKKPQEWPDLPVLESQFSLLGRIRNKKAGFLSGGERQIVAVSRALLAAPRILLLDEPSCGLSSELAENLFHYVRRLARKFDFSTIIVEQNRGLASEISDRTILMSQGSLIRNSERNS